MLRKRACKHCVGQFQPIRLGHLFCSDTCRKLAFKAKNRAKTQLKKNKKLSEKLKKLANSAFGLYLVKEIRRSGTVEILQGHNSQSLTDLVSLRRRCTAAGGYDNGDSLSYYELSHIYPVSGKERLGLLNIANLAITPKTFNRKHGKKLPVKGYKGSSIPRASLLKEWKVSAAKNSLETLKLARKYIGEEFDVWLKKHLINQTQKGEILKKLKEAGYDNDVLKTMGLRELKAIANEEEIPYFSIDKEPSNSIEIALCELKRLDLNPELAQVLNSFLELDDTFESPKFIFHGNEQDLKLFQEYVSQQTFLCIHGQPFEGLWRDKPLQSYFESFSKKVKLEPKAWDDDDIL